MSQWTAGINNMKKQDSQFLDWIKDANEKEKAVDKMASYFESDVKDIAAKHGLMMKRNIVNESIEKKPAVNQGAKTKVAKTKEVVADEVYGEGMISDAIFQSETFKKAVTSIVLGNKELLNHIIAETLKNIDITVHPKKT